MLSYAWLCADYFVLFWGVDFGHGQVVSSLLLNAVLSYVFAPDYVFVPVFRASIVTINRA